MITSEKWQKLRNWMQQLGITEKSLEEKFIIGSGKGGQKLQKTNSCVWLKHVPTGITIKCQQSRLRETNRYYARKLLCEKQDIFLHQEKSTKRKEIEKIRRQKRKRSKRAKEKILEDKRWQSERIRSRKVSEN